MSEIVYGYMKRCDCGNLYLPTGRSICEVCRGIAQHEKFARRRKAHDARRADKVFKKQKERKACATLLTS